MQSTYQHYAQQTPELCPDTDIMLRHLTDLQTLCQNIYVWSIYRHKARTLESSSYARHLNPVHIQTLCWHLNPFHIHTLCSDT